MVQSYPAVRTVANDLSNLTAMDKKQWEVNLTRGVTYRHGSNWHEDNVKNMKELLKDFKSKDVRIIIANFNQTVATHMFCNAAKEQIYGPRYQWIMLGYASESAWWNEKTDCSMQELIRAINGTLQTRIPNISMDDSDDRPNHVWDYIEHFSTLKTNYFDAYAYDTVWSLVHMYRSGILLNQTNIKTIVNNIDFIGATGKVRYLNGRRIGEILVEQYVACRMMNDDSCQIPCYENDNDCNLTVVKVFLAKNSAANDDLPSLYKLHSIMWHGSAPPRDRTNQTIVFEHIYPSVFISITICSGIGLIISISLFVFNIHFRLHRYIRMSSPLLNNIILGGCMLAYISTILMGINSSLFPNTAFTDMLMNIICAGIHDSRLLVVVGALLCIDSLILIAWQLFDPIHRQIVYDAPHRPKHNQDIEIIPYREECKGHHTTFWFLVLIFYKGLLMAYGSFLSWRTRHVTIPALNDSRYIGLSVYIVFICCVLGSLVAFIPSEQIQFSYCLRSFFIMTCTTVTVCLVFVPKIVEVYHDPYAKKKQPRIMRRFHTRAPKHTILTNQHLNDALMDNQQLQLVLSLQEETLDRLIKQINECASESDGIVEPVELERLMVSSDKAEENLSMDEDDDNYYPIISNSKLYEGRVARAVSLCLYNKIHTVQKYWPEAIDKTHYSISQLQVNEHSQSRLLFNTTSQSEEFDEQTPNLLQIPSAKDTEIEYDGLNDLDENRLNKMIETDLVSSYC
ncbi:unnamed protein product [Rotaria socialis]|uniref:G-protein coupled receptors family 3 profile domain-containing protein n=1 Tax=Rotaria socialis TaxID=392032 RepID=A0A818WMI7_9BILA|nr:unnamed protein product [Rotaria socialis]CAF4542594.1 unnamed protein product [Rotaria socialis]